MLVRTGCFYRSALTLSLPPIQHNERSYFLILEYCGGGDLHRYLRNHGRLSESIACFFMRQLAAGLRYLWQKNTMHRDLKPQNLLLSSDSPTAVLKIADFGFARHLSATTMADTLCGSPLYMAPEIMEGRRYDSKADLWSVGTILFEVLAGHPPFGGNSQVELLRNIQSKPLVVPDENLLSPACRACIAMVLKSNPEDRCSHEEFFSCGFIHLERDDSTSPSALETTSEPSQVSAGRQLMKVPPAAVPPPPPPQWKQAPPSRRRPPPTPRAHPFMPLTASPPVAKSLAGALRGGGMPPLNLGVPAHLHGDLSPLTGSDDYVMVDECIEPYPVASQQRRLSRRSQQQPLQQQLTMQPRQAAMQNSSSAGSARLLEAAVLCLQIVEVLGKRAVTLAQLGDASVVAALQAQHVSYIAGHAAAVRISSTPPRSLDLSLGMEGDEPALSEGSTEESLCELMRACPLMPEPKLLIRSLPPILTSAAALDLDSTRRFGEALALYLKSLGMIKSAILRAKQARETLDAAVGASGAPDGSVERHILVWGEDLLHWQSQQFSAVLDRAEQCRSKLAACEEQQSQPAITISSSVSADELVLRAALRMGEEASLDEALGQWTQGKDRLQKALFLLESLLIDPKPPSLRGMGATLSQGLSPSSNSSASVAHPTLFVVQQSSRVSLQVLVETFSRRMDAMTRRQSFSTAVAAGSFLKEGPTK
jgi:serine/threonine protein kinase